MYKLSKNERGFVDPLSIVAILFLVITTTIGVGQVLKTQNIFNKAADISCASFDKATCDVTPGCKSVQDPSTTQTVSCTKDEALRGMYGCTVTYTTITNPTTYSTFNCSTLDISSCRSGMYGCKITYSEETKYRTVTKYTTTVTYTYKCSIGSSTSSGDCVRAGGSWVATPHSVNTPYQVQEAYTVTTENCTGTGTKADPTTTTTVENFSTRTITTEGAFYCTGNVATTKPTTIPTTMPTQPPANSCSILTCQSGYIKNQIAGATGICECVKIATPTSNPTTKPTIKPTAIPTITPTSTPSNSCFTLSCPANTTKTQVAGATGVCYCAQGTIRPTPTVTPTEIPRLVKDDIAFPTPTIIPRLAKDDVAFPTASPTPSPTNKPSIFDKFRDAFGTGTIFENQNLSLGSEQSMIVPPKDVILSNNPQDLTDFYKGAGVAGGAGVAVAAGTLAIPFIPQAGAILTLPTAGQATVIGAISQLSAIGTASYLGASALDCIAPVSQLLGKDNGSLCIAGSNMAATGFSLDPIGFTQMVNSGSQSIVNVVTQPKKVWDTLAFLGSIRPTQLTAEEQPLALNNITVKPNGIIIDDIVATDVAPVTVLNTTNDIKALTSVSQPLSSSISNVQNQVITASNVFSGLPNQLNVFNQTVSPTTSITGNLFGNTPVVVGTTTPYYQTGVDNMAARYSSNPENYVGIQAIVKDTIENEIPKITEALKYAPEYVPLVPKPEVVVENVVPALPPIPASLIDKTTGKLLSEYAPTTSPNINQLDAYFIGSQIHDLNTVVANNPITQPTQTLGDKIADAIYRGLDLFSFGNPLPAETEVVTNNAVTVGANLPKTPTEPTIIKTDTANVTLNYSTGKVERRLLPVSEIDPPTFYSNYGGSFERYKLVEFTLPAKYYQLVGGNLDIPKIYEIYPDGSYDGELKSGVTLSNYTGEITEADVDKGMNKLIDQYKYTIEVNNGIGIPHGDIKPDNILVEDLPNGEKEFHFIDYRGNEKNELSRDLYNFRDSIDQFRGQQKYIKSITSPTPPSLPQQVVNSVKNTVSNAIDKVTGFLGGGTSTPPSIPPILPGTTFNPEVEVKNILAQPRADRPKALADFKAKLSYQQNGITDMQLEIEAKIRKNPNILLKDLNAIIEKGSVKYGLTKEQITKFEDGILAFDEKRNTVIEILDKYQNPNDLFEAMFGRQPQGKVTVSRGPMTINLRIYNVQDYNFVHNGKYFAHSSPVDKVANSTSGGFIVDKGTLIPNTSSLVIIENNTSISNVITNIVNPYIFLHEEEHAINRLLIGIDVFPTNIEMTTEYVDILTAIETNDPAMIELKLRDYLINQRLSADTKYADEIIAYTIDGTPKTDIINILGNDPYDFYNEQKKSIKGFLELNSKIDKILLNNTLNDVYRNTPVIEGLKAFDTLIGKGYTRDQAIVILQKEPLTNWSKTADRAIAPVNQNPIQKTIQNIKDLFGSGASTPPTVPNSTVGTTSIPVALQPSTTIIQPLNISETISSAVEDFIDNLPIPVKLPKNPTDVRILATDPNLRHYGIHIRGFYFGSSKQLVVDKTLAHGSIINKYNLEALNEDPVAQIIDWSADYILVDINHGFTMDVSGPEIAQAMLNYNAKPNLNIKLDGDYGTLGKGTYQDTLSNIAKGLKPSLFVPITSNTPQTNIYPQTVAGVKLNTGNIPSGITPKELPKLFGIIPRTSPLINTPLGQIPSEGTIAIEKLSPSIVSYTYDGKPISEVVEITIYDNKTYVISGTDRVIININSGIPTVDYKFIPYENITGRQKVGIARMQNGETNGIQLAQKFDSSFAILSNPPAQIANKNIVSINTANDPPLTKAITLITAETLKAQEITANIAEEVVKAIAKYYPVNTIAKSAREIIINNAISSNKTVPLGKMLSDGTAMCFEKAELCSIVLRNFGFKNPTIEVITNGNDYHAVLNIGSGKYADPTIGKILTIKDIKNSGYRIYNGSVELKDVKGLEPVLNVPALMEPLPKTGPISKANTFVLSKPVSGDTVSADVVKAQGNKIAIADGPGSGISGKRDVAEKIVNELLTTGSASDINGNYALVEFDDKSLKYSARGSIMIAGYYKLGNKVEPRLIYIRPDANERETPTVISGEVNTENWAGIIITTDGGPHMFEDSTLFHLTDGQPNLGSLNLDMSALGRSNPDQKQLVFDDISKYFNEALAKSTFEYTDDATMVVHGFEIDTSPPIPQNPQPESSAPVLPLSTDQKIEQIFKLLKNSDSKPTSKFSDFVSIVENRIDPSDEPQMLQFLEIPGELQQGLRVRLIPGIGTVDKSTGEQGYRIIVTTGGPAIGSYDPLPELTEISKTCEAILRIKCIPSRK